MFLIYWWLYLSMADNRHWKTSPKIKATLQLHYAGMDERVNEGIAGYEEALKKAGVKYEQFLYEGAQHAFYNDTAPSRHNEDAAKKAWQRAVDLFNKKLK